MKKYHVQKDDPKNGIVAIYKGHVLVSRVDKESSREIRRAAEFLEVSFEQLMEEVNKESK